MERRGSPYVQKHRGCPSVLRRRAPEGSPAGARNRPSSESWPRLPVGPGQVSGCSPVNLSPVCLTGAERQLQERVKKLGRTWKRAQTVGVRDHTSPVKHVAGAHSAVAVLDPARRCPLASAGPDRTEHLGSATPILQRGQSGDLPRTERQAVRARVPRRSLAPASTEPGAELLRTGRLAESIPELLPGALLALN